MILESVKVPTDYLRSPIFAASKQKEGRIVVIKKLGRTYEIGGFKALPGTQKPCPALDIRHGRALFTMLTFYDKLYVDNFESDKHKICFSITQFCKRYAKSNNSTGGQNARAVSELLNDLMHCWFRVTYQNGEKRTYRILKDISIYSKPRRQQNVESEVSQDELWLDQVELHPEFYKLLSDYTELGWINLKVLTSIRSPLAQSIYTYMPSRALYRTEGNAFPISLSTILQEVGHKVPEHKSLRKQLFTQNKTPILAQLDGLPFVNGILRVKLVETEDDSDYKLLFWNGLLKNQEQQLKKKFELESKCPKLKSYWLESNRSVDEFNNRIKTSKKDLQHYQKEVLERACVKIEGNESFMSRALALVGETKFNEIASEVKSIVLDPSSSVQNPTKLFINLVCNSIAQKT